MKKTRKLSLEYRKLFRNKKYKKSIILGVFLLALAGILSALTIGYADKVAGNPIGDFFLNNLPTINLFWFRAYGTFFIALSVFALGFLKPRYLPLLMKSVGLMYIVRALFIPLTHLKFYPEKVAVAAEYSIFKFIPYSGNDLFFSGHVALPFLVALIFWDNKPVRIYLLAASVLSGVVALFSKSHYSIDIFAVPFIVYSIFKIGERLFKEDFSYIK